jgi:hypothetical protein
MHLPLEHSTNRKGVDHGLEAEIDLSAADDLGDILQTVSGYQPM